MSGVSDKARFHLERSIPDLHELERKKIFTREEITKIASKRSEFEHRLNVRGPQPADYTRYIEYESSLENLRRRRAKRLGVKGGAHIGPRRILYIFNRATQKFPGDLSLWTEYLSYAKKQNAYKTVVEIITKLVRLHPTKPKVWIYAANSAFGENGDMTEARSYMQRGLRFCKDSKQLWLTYARLELMYLSKLAKRRSILGLDQYEPMDAKDEAPDADVIALPAITAEDMDPQKHQALQSAGAQPGLKTTPAFSGAIPIAIFDAAHSRFEDIDVAEKIFEMCFEFSEVAAAKNVAHHIVESTASLRRSSPVLVNTYVREPLIGIHSASPDFPRAVRESIARLKTSTKESPSLELAHRTVSWTTSFLQQDLDPDIRKVLASIAKGAVDHYGKIHDDPGVGNGDDFADVLKKLKAANLGELATASLQWALMTWPGDERFLTLEKG